MKWGWAMQLTSKINKIIKGVQCRTLQATPINDTITTYIIIYMM
jgi:hypothetical protein